jgi:nucleoid DNA-binding protein
MSMSMKDYLIRVMSVKMMVAESTIEKVINHQFLSAYEAMKTNDEIELSGWGKLIFNRNKALKKLLKMESQIRVFTAQRDNVQLSEGKRASAEFKLNNVLRNYELLKTKLNGESVEEREADIRGMEE